MKKSVELSFRVNEVMGNAVIKVTDGGRLIAEYRRERLAPGEMEHIMLPAALLKRAEGTELTVSVELQGEV